MLCHFKCSEIYPSFPNNFFQVIGPLLSIHFFLTLTEGKLKLPACKKFNLSRLKKPFHEFLP